MCVIQASQRFAGPWVPWVPCRPWKPLKKSCATSRGGKPETDRHPDVLARIREVDDIVSAHRNNQCGLIYALQDGVSFEDDPGRLEALHHVGVRIIQPTYNRRNLLGDGCMEPADAGLSRTGKEAIDRMMDLGILLDLSHCGRQTTADAIELASKPVAFTHTGCFCTG